MLKLGWIGRPTKWICPIGGWNSPPSQGWRTHRNLLRKSAPPFQSQQLEARSSQVKGILCPLPPGVSPELSYQDMQQQPFLLTVAYTWGLQYWVERLNLPADLDFCPLARSVLELKERVKEHVVFSKQDVIQGLGRTDQELQVGGPNPPQLTLKALSQTLLGSGRHMSPLPHHLDPSLRGETPQFPQLGFEWRTGQLVKMQA